MEYRVIFVNTYFGWLTEEDGLTEIQAIDLAEKLRAAEGCPSRDSVVVQKSDDYAFWFNCEGL